MIHVYAHELFLQLDRAGRGSPGRRVRAHRRVALQLWEGPKDKVPLSDFSNGPGWVEWPILSLLWPVFDFSSWIMPDLLILWLREQQLALGGGSGSDGWGWRG